MGSFEGKVAVVTGAGSGLGRALAVGLARRGALLSISDVNEVGLTDTAERVSALNAKPHVETLDVSDQNAVRRYASSVVDHFGIVHQLYNNAGLVLTSIGYRGKAIRDLPFDDAAAVVPNDGGRVIDPQTGQPVHGSYVAGWIKRGPTGFIGTNKSCALETVQSLVDDYNAGLLTGPRTKPAALQKLVRSRRPDVVSAAGWKAIDEAEIERGGEHRPRDKFTSVADMLAAAATAPAPSFPQRVLAGFRH